MESANVFGSIRTLDLGELVGRFSFTEWIYLDRRNFCFSV
jgi:hypothetical protein